jgi:hypothetical protein
MKKPLFFIHTPKTGGSTFRYILETNSKDVSIQYFPGIHWPTWPNPEVLIPAKVHEQKDLYYGHFSFGIHERIEGPYAYAVFLRDPVRRVISGYNHLHQKGPKKLHEIVRNLSLEEYIDRALVLDADNGLVRRISGIQDKVPFGQVEEEHFRMAQENLEQHFLFVGFTEFFNASVFLLAQEIGLKNRYYWRQNTNKKRASKKIASSTLEKVRDLNVWDQKLYEKALSNFKMKLAESTFDNRQFERNNSFYNVRILPVKAWKKIQVELKKYF